VTPEIRRDIHGRPVKVLGFIRDPKAKKGVAEPNPVPLSPIFGHQRH
jgi:hypothetical protein